MQDSKVNYVKDDDTHVHSGNTCCPRLYIPSQFLLAAICILITSDHVSALNWHRLSIVDVILNSIGSTATNLKLYISNSQRNMFHCPCRLWPNYKEELWSLFEIYLMLFNTYIFHDLFQNSCSFWIIVPVINKFYQVLIQLSCESWAFLNPVDENDCSPHKL